ncbi:hypothetical protein [Streptomyces sp. NPDC047097]|uniref:hypothetical protein n=1 Tax=Streptomyces sp. NPDC047097 TaxID=3155260 RepID=UPI0033DE5AE9
MPNAQVVGRVAVRILPDTSRFKEDARSELERAEKGLEVRARVTLDADRVKEQAKQVHAEAQRALREIHLKVALDNEGSIRAGISRIQAELDRLDATDIKIDLNEGDLNAGLDMLRERLAEIETITLRVDESSQESIRAAVARIDAELSKLAAVEIDVRVDEDELRAMRELLSGDLRLDLSVDWDDDTSVKQAIARLDAELAKLADVSLHVGLDEASLRQARSDLQETLDLRARLKVEADKAEAQRAYDLIQNTLDNIRVSPRLDPAEVAKVKRQLEAAYQHMGELRAKITPELDALAKAKVEREIDDLQDKIDGLKAEIEPETAKGAVALVIAEMARLARNRIVNLFPRVNVSSAASAAAMLQALSGARVLGDTFERLGNVLRNLDRTVPIVGTLASAIAGLAGWAIAGASNLFALSSSLAQIGATSLALPGILGGMAIGVGATVAAFKDFNTVLPQVKGQLSQLQDLISGNFWAQAKEPIRELIDTLLPELRDGFEQTSTQLGQFFGGLADALKSSLAPALGGMFDDLSSSIDIATAGTGAFANIIRVLGEVGAGYLPQLAGWFVDVATKASDWLTQKGESGLRQEIDAGVQALKDLGGVLVESGGILAGISRAATEAGGSTLAMLRDTLAGVHEAVDSSGAQAALVGLFTAAHEAMANLATAGGSELKRFFSQFVGLLTAVLPQVGAILGTAVGGIAAALNQPAVLAGVYALFDGLQAGVTGVLPALAPLGAALGAVLTITGALAAQLGPLVAAALTPLALAFTALVPAVLPVIDLLGSTLTGVFLALAPVIATLVPVIQDALALAFQALATVLPVVAALFAQIMTAVAPLVAQLIEGLAPILPVVAGFLAALVTAAMPLVDILLRLLQAVIVPLIPVVLNVAEAVLPPLQAAFEHLVTAVSPLLEALVAVVDFLMPILAPAITFIATLLGESLAAAIDGVALVFDGAIGLIKSVWDIFAGLFTGDWGRVWNGIKGVFTSIWDLLVGAFKIALNIGILGIAKKVLTGVKALWETIWNGIKSFATGLWNALKGAGSVFMTGLRGYIDDGLNAIRGLWSRIWDGISSYFTQTWTTVKSLATSGMSQLKSAVESGIKTAVQFIKDMPGKAKSALGDLGSTLLGAGKKLIQGFIDGIGNMFGKVKDKLGSLTDKLTDWKGPESLDRVLLVDAGRLVIDGFIRGLESRYDAVKRSLRGLTDDVAATDFGTPTISSFGASRGVTAAITSALAGPESGGVTKVLNYYAAPSSSLPEEDLFAAANRARMGW